MPKQSRLLHVVVAIALLLGLIPLSVPLDAQPSPPEMAATAAFGQDAAPLGVSAQAINVAVTITGFDTSPVVVGQGTYVGFRVARTEANPTNLNLYGTITVDDGHGSTCSHTVSSGTYTDDWESGCTLTPYTAGLLTITATFVPANPADWNGASGTASLQVLRADTATALTVAPNPAGEHQTVLLTATVAPVAPGSGTPTGVVRFYADTYLLGAGTISGGMATFSTSFAEVGTRVVTAGYIGDDNYVSSASAPVTLSVAGADLRVSKFIEPEGTIRAGQIFTYTIYVDNLGPVAAPNVVITDTLLSSSQVTIYGCAFSVYQGGGAVTQFTCTTGQLVSTQFGTDIGTFSTNLLDPLSTTSQGRLLASFRLLANEAIDVNNVVRVVSDAFDPDMSNNLASASISVTAVADLAVTKQVEGEVQVVGQAGGVFNIATSGTAFPQTPSYTTSATQVTAGRRARYTLTVTNSGPSTAENVAVVDRLPAGVVFYPGSLVLSQGSCQTGAPGSPLDPMTCGLGTLVPGQAATIAFQVVVGSAALPGQILLNDALVTSDIFDVDNSDNRASVQTTVNTWADMSVSKSSVGEVVTGCDPALGTSMTTDQPSAVTAGKTLRYELTVQNNGASDAVNVQVLDLLPDIFGTGQTYATTFDHAVGATCRPDDEHALWTILWPSASATGQAIVCDLGTVTAGARRTFDVYVRVDPSVPQGTVLDNGALVMFGPSSPPSQPPALFPGFPTIPTTLPVTNDPYTDNNFVVQNTTVNAVADLLVEKTSSPVKGFAGEQNVYTITVTNRGPSTARDVVVVDTLPSDVTYEIDTMGAACSLTHTGPDVLTCQLGNVGSEQVVTWNISVLIHPDTVIDPPTPGTTIVNQATVTSTTTDVCPASNAAAAETLVLGKADLKVAKYGPSGPVTANEDLTYQIVVDNLGPGYAHNAVVDDLLQSTGRFTLLYVASNRPAICTPTSGVFDQVLQMHCGLQGALGVGSTASARWILTVVIRATEAQTVNNVASLTGSDLDPNQTNNEAVARTNIEGVADLSIKQLVYGQVVADGCAVAPQFNRVTAGLRLTYVLTITNGGPSTAHNVLATDELPTGVAITSVSATQGTCLTGAPGAVRPLEVTASGDKIACGLGTMTVGAQAQITLVAQVPAGTSAGTVLKNDVEVTSDSLDLNNANDAAINLATVSATADLAVDKAQSPAFVRSGDPIEYTITVRNHGPSDARSAVISDTLPTAIAGATWTCQSFYGGTCPASGQGSLRHSVDLPVGAQLVYTVRGVRTPSSIAQVISNTASVLAPPGVLDCNQANSSDTVVNQVRTVYLPLVSRERVALQGPDLVVESVIATTSAVTVTIKNQGALPVQDRFWVDVYLGPFRPPTQVNETWNDLGSMGLVWAVRDGALPLESGETLTLSLDDIYWDYAGSLSQVTWPLPVGMAVYAQVDSAGDPGRGSVLELHEMMGGFYNNILGPVAAVAGAGAPPAVSRATQVELRGMPSR